MSNPDKKDLLLFFDRPMEPCFMQKGHDKSIFQLPDHYYPEKYKKWKSSLNNRFGNDAGRTLPVLNIALPDLRLSFGLKFNEQFSVWVPKHQKMAAKLIDVFMGMRDVQDLMSVCAYCQLRVNPYMFNYCLSVAMLHRQDTKGISFPTFAELFPDKFIDPKVFRKAREFATTVPKGSRARRSHSLTPIIIPHNYTASNLEPEQRVAYFREDVGTNLHHWHWHLVYPSEASDRSIVDKDRRGELFYYMHQQIIARYDIERLCNGLDRVRPLTNFREPIIEAYFPKLDSQVASRSWPPRFASTTLKDVDRPVDEIKLDMSQLDTWHERIMQAINDGRVRTSNNQEMRLTETNGIDVLGNMVESSIISPNRNYYGDLHNSGHIFIAYSHDPDHRHLEEFGVMGDVATAMRDPVFYRWHKYIDNIFNAYKIKLTPYTTDQLEFPDIRVSSIALEGSAGANRIATQWEQSTVELSRGLDFTPRGSILARFTHLQHDEYNYVIHVNNTSGKSMMGMFRIFIAPAVDEKGNPIPFEEQRRLMIELDKFPQPLGPGNKTVRHSSVDSSVTIPYERTFRDQNQRPGDQGSQEAAAFDFCGCGWPQHMLVPKGNERGYPMVLFCMVSNWNNDRVEQDLGGSCNDAASYCGLRDRRYPDRRAMGYPFDRRGRSGVNNLSDFLTPNMAVQKCTINFRDATRVREEPTVKVV